MNEGEQMASDDQHPIDAKVQTLLERRLSSARELADAAAALHAARERLDEAQRSYSALFKQAERAGWDRKELTGHLGLEEPARQSRRRSSSRKTAQSQ